eukprot:403343291
MQSQAFASPSNQNQTNEDFSPYKSPNFANNSVDIQRNNQDQNLDLHISKVKMLWERKKNALLKNKHANINLMNKTQIEGEYLTKQDRLDSLIYTKGTHFRLGFDETNYGQSQSQVHYNQSNSIRTPQMPKDLLKIIDDKDKQSKKTYSNIKMGNKKEDKFQGESTTKKIYDLKSIKEARPKEVSRDIARTMKKTNFKYGFRSDITIYKNQIELQKQGDGKQSQRVENQKEQSKQSSNQDQNAFSELKALSQRILNKSIKTPKQQNDLEIYKRINQQMRKTNFNIGKHRDTYQTTNQDTLQQLKLNLNPNVNIRKEVLNAKSTHFDFGYDTNQFIASPENFDPIAFEQQKKQKFQTLINFWKVQQCIVGSKKTQQRGKSSDFMPKRKIQNHFQTTKQFYQEKALNEENNLDLPALNQKHQKTIYDENLNYLFSKEQDLTSHSQEVHNDFQNHSQFSPSIDKLASSMIYLDQKPSQVQTTKLRMQTAQFRFGPVTRGDIELNQQDKTHSQISFAPYESDNINYMERYNKLKDMQKLYHESHFQFSYQSPDKSKNNIDSQFDVISQKEDYLLSEQKEKFPKYDDSYYQTSAPRCQKNIKPGHIQISMTKQPGQDVSFYGTVRDQFDVTKNFKSGGQFTDVQLGKTNKTINYDIMDKSQTNFKLGYTQDDSMKLKKSSTLNQTSTIQHNSQNRRLLNNLIVRKQKRDNVGEMIRERPRTIEQLRTCNNTFYNWIQPVPMKQIKE